MDVYLHTLIATSCIFCAFYAGQYYTRYSFFDEVVTKTLEKLEADGFIRTAIDKDGDKELIPIIEIIKKGY